MFSEEQICLAIEGWLRLCWLTPLVFSAYMLSFYKADRAASESQDRKNPAPPAPTRHRIPPPPHLFLCCPRPAFSPSQACLSIHINLHSVNTPRSWIQKLFIADNPHLSFQLGQHFTVPCPTYNQSWAFGVCGSLVLMLKKYFRLKCKKRSISGPGN